MRYSIFDFFGNVGKGIVLLFSRSNQLAAMREGEDVVLNPVLPAVMLMKRPGECVVDEIVLGEDVRAALVEVDAPAARHAGA